MIEEFGDELTIEFKTPIKLADLEFPSVTLEEPTGAQLQASYKAAGEPMGQLFSLIANVGKISPAVVKQMRQRDLQRAADFFAHFDPENSLSSSETKPQS